MEQFNLDEFYRSISGFWNSTAPILFAHIIAFLAIRWIGGINWHLLERLEHFLETDRYQRWRKILDEFDLRSKTFFLLAIGIFVYFAFFDSVLELFGGFPHISIVYSRTEFWEESRPLSDLVKIGSYGNSTDLEIWQIEDIQEKFLEEFRSRYPDSYRSSVSWLSDSYYQWLTYYRLSLLFSVLVIIFFINSIFKPNWKYRNKSRKKRSSLMRLAILLFFAFIMIVFSRYQAEQYIERKLKAETNFVITQLQLDTRYEESQLNEENTNRLRSNIYRSLKTVNPQYIDLFWVSRILEQYIGVHREFRAISDEEFVRNFGDLDSQLDSH